MRLKGIIIGKLERDQRSGVRGQKRNDLRLGWRARLGGVGIDKKTVLPLASNCQVAGPRLEGPSVAFLYQGLAGRSGLQP